MSYYGIRKMKNIIDENGKYNITCEYYDSSIRDYNGNRVWNTLEAGKGFFNNGFNTKEELERALFEDTLDGNIHGTGGKYGCIAWGSNKVQLSDEEKKHLENLENEYWNLHGTQNKIVDKIKEENPNITWEEIKENAEYKEITDKIIKIGQEKREYRYNTYFKRWKEYLKQQNKNKANGKTYVIKLNYSGYKDIYVSSKGSRVTKFCHGIHSAKLFTKSLEELKEMFCNNPKFTHVRAIEVSPYIIGKGKYRHVEMEWETEDTIYNREL